MVHSFKLTVGIRKAIDDVPVYFKLDGGRFENERTLKLNMNTKYALEIATRPSQVIRSLNIHGGSVTLEEKSREDAQAMYSGLWLSTGLQTDKKGGRQNIPMLFEFEELGTLKVVLQTKFYPETERNHSRWGTAISRIEYDCTVPDNASYIDVVKTTIR